MNAEGRTNITFLDDDGNQLVILKLCYSFHFFRSFVRRKLKNVNHHLFILEQHQWNWWNF